MNNQWVPYPVTLKNVESRRNHVTGEIVWRLIYKEDKQQIIAPWRKGNPPSSNEELEIGMKKPNYFKGSKE